MNVEFIKNIQVIGTGIALPDRVVLSSEIDQQQGLKVGTTEKLTGITSRHYATTESATDLAVIAIEQALHLSTIPLEKIDCLISASGTLEQAIPCNAAKIHRRLNLTRPIPAFDINMTCLSALMAMDLAATMIASGQYENILVASADIASVGIDWSDRETGGLFGDGAAAFIISKGKDKRCGIIASHFATHSDGLEFCQIRGGGSLNHPSKISGDYKKYGMFEMQGKEVYKLTAKVIEAFIETLFAKTDYCLDDMDWIVPHHASQLALLHLQKKLKIPEHKLINLLSTRGNQIAASIPSAFHELKMRGQTKPGDKVLLIGTSAGLSLGGVVLVL